MNDKNVLSYELHMSKLENQKAIKKHTDLMVKEIQQVAGSDVDLRISVEPHVKSRGLYLVTMNLNGLSGGPLTVKKSGRQVLSTLKKARRVVMRRIKSQINRYKSLRQRRRLQFREQGAL